jgi:hypothetical protein
MADSISIDGVILETVGTTAVIPEGSGGSQNNTNTWNTGAVGSFVMKDTLGNTFGMVVSANNPTGALSANTDSLMVVRTVSSQGLTDNGTLSVFVNPQNSGAWTLDLNFSFYNLNEGAINLASPYSLDKLLLTSLDIDYSQRYYTSNSTFTANQLYGPSQLTSAPALAGYTGFTAPGNSSFNNPAYAVSSTGTGSSFNVHVAHNSQALFMFEFRDPSSIVPEPSSALLAGIGAFALVGYMRRARKAA